MFNIKNKIPKYKKIEVRDNLSMTNFINELQQMNIYNSLDANPQFNPNDNYEICERLLVHARDKHLPIKKVKYCKNKHKLNKWMTNGILKSIKQKIYCIKKWSKQVLRIIMYMILLKPILIPIKISCDKILERQRNFIITKHFYSIKIILKKTWSTIKETLNRTNNTKDIPLIYHNDTIIQDPTELGNAFNQYFIDIAPWSPYAPRCIAKGSARDDIYN